MKLNRGDRVILVLLILLMAVYVAYASLKPRLNSAMTPPSEEQTVDTTIIETAAIEVKDSTAVRPKTSPIRTDKYPGPPPRTERKGSKMRRGETLDLNTADTIALQMVPGIGPSFARRIFKYRALLGGFYVVEQLQEVYGMDRERYDQIAPYLTVKSPVRTIVLSPDSISYHPYLQWRHRKVLSQLLRQGTPVTWDELMKSSAFSQDDSLRLSPYLPLQEEKSAEINPIP